MYYLNQDRLFGLVMWSTPRSLTFYTIPPQFESIMMIRKKLILLAKRYIHIIMADQGSTRVFTILYFASASSFTSKDAEQLPAPLPLSNLFDKLEGQYAGIKEKVLQSCFVTINLEYVDIVDQGSEDSGLMIKEGDEVAIIPPVSSG